MALSHIHLFHSRTATFVESKVLQESIITRFQKSKTPPIEISITRSEGRDLLNQPRGQSLPYNRVVLSRELDNTIRMPELENDFAVVECVEKWPQRFSEMGLRISTGPVVLFRAAEHLLFNANHVNAVPLLSAHNIRPFQCTWPVEKKKWPVAVVRSESSKKLLIANSNCVLLKRFSAKEEKRRLTAACLIASDFAHQEVAIENHLNYIFHLDRNLSADEVLGIATVLNSALLDRYFRSISGNTQVNATEIRQLPFPNLEFLANLGSKVRTLIPNSLAGIEKLLLDELGISGALADYVQGFTK